MDSVGGRLALHEHTIKYTSIRHLNDPFECMFGCFPPADVERFLTKAEIAKSDRDKWNEFCAAYSFILPNEANELENLRLNSRKQWVQFLEEISDGTRRKLMASSGKRLGVASFSAHKDSILMWSHYAQQHKGIVIGYDTDCFQSIFPGPSALLPVVYADTRIEMPLSVDVPWGTLDRLATTKFRDWSYEHEWRSVVRGDEKLMEDSGAIFPRIDSRYIREINIGACAEFELKRACCVYCADHPECNYYEAHFHRQEYALDFTHKTVNWE